MSVLTLRILRSEDSDIVSLLIQEPSVMENANMPPNGAEIFIQRSLELVGAPCERILGIVDSTDSILGIIGLEMDHFCAEKSPLLFYYVLPNLRGKGIASEAVQLICQLAFDQMGILKIESRTFSTNPASQRVLIKNQFTPTRYFTSRGEYGAATKGRAMVIYGRTCPTPDL